MKSYGIENYGQENYDIGINGQKETTECMRVRSLPMEGRAKGCAEMCRNLRRKFDGLHPVGQVKPMEGVEELPVCVIQSSVAGRIGLTVVDGRLTAIYYDSGDEACTLCAMPGQTTCAVTVSHDKVIVMTDEGPVTVTIDASGRCSATLPRPDLPTLRFTTYSQMTVSATAPGRKLTGGYSSRSNSLNRADTNALTEDLLQGYLRLCENAEQAGMVMQPVLLRYRYESESGQVLYRSPAVLVGPTDGAQCVRQMQINLPSDLALRPDLGLTANACRVQLSEASGRDGGDAALVHRLVVEMSHPLHAVNHKKKASASFGVIGATSFMRVYMPGVTPDSDFGAMAHALLATGDAAFRTVAIVMHPFDSSEPFSMRVMPTRMPLTTPAEGMEMLAKLLRLRVEIQSPLKALFRLPHRLAAFAGTSAGEHVVWGNIRVKAFEGYAADELAVETADEAWHGVTDVEMADGSHRLTSVAGSTGAPLRLSSLLSYPHPQAVKITVWVRRGNVDYSVTRALTPTSDGLAAASVEQGCTPIPLTAASTPMPTAVDTSATVDLPDVAMSAFASNPFEVSDFTAASSAEITACCGHGSRGVAWDYSRRRLYIMTKGGTFLAALDRSGKWADFNRIDSRPVAYAAHIVDTDDTARSIAMIAGDDLISIDNGRVKLIERNTSATLIGWDPVEGELWLTDDAGRTRVMHLPMAQWFEYTPVAPLAYLSMPDTLMVKTSDTVLSTELGTAGDETTIAYRLGVDFNSLSRPSHLVADISSSNFAATLSVEGVTDLRESGELVCADCFVGSIYSPIEMGMVAFPTRKAAVTVEGRCSLDTVISYLSLSSVEERQA